jgi:hypothetical protein
MTTSDIVVMTFLLLPLTAYGGEIADLHRETTNRDITLQQLKASRGYKQIESDSHGITEFGIERTECFGRCPQFTLRLFADGRVEYYGVRNVEHVGKWTGRLPSHYFRKVAHYVAEMQFTELSDTYHSLVTDSPTVYTTVVIDGVRKTISNEGLAGPPKLWALEELIELGWRNTLDKKQLDTKSNDSEVGGNAPRRPPQ